MTHPWCALQTAQDKQRQLLSKYHSGPQVTTGKPKLERGLRPQEYHATGRVKVIVQNGEVILPKRFERVKPNIIAAEAKLAAQRHESPQLNAESLVTAFRPSGGAGVSLTERSSATTRDPASRGRAAQDSSLA